MIQFSLTAKAQKDRKRGQTAKTRSTLTGGESTPSNSMRFYAHSWDLWRADVFSWQGSSELPLLLEYDGDRHLVAESNKV